VEVVAVVATLHNLKEAQVDLAVVAVVAVITIRFTHQHTDSINRPQEIMLVLEPIILAVVVVLPVTTVVIHME
jgi:hypothetical protein